MTSNKKIDAFKREVWDYYKMNGRNDLPWRKTTDPYKILVSEVMLQQTQVPRVIKKYKSFLKKFPTVRVLARATLAQVLKEWSGLGYNRRGKYLHDAAKKIVADFGGDMKKALEHPLPGVGPYTRAAVRTFAFNEPHTMIETNIRTAFIHHFFADSKSVSDKELLSRIEKAAEDQDPRTWHWALMDYGVHIKKIHQNPSRKSKHYTKQSKFEGSVRQLRGAILRDFSKKGLPMSFSNFIKQRGRERAEAALAGLERDGLIKKEKGRRPEGSARREKWRIA